MGKSWDRALPPKEAFKEMFRVLKPGALAFIMSSPRQDVLWRMMAMLESVGFELRQSMLFHCFASGFPKAYDVSLGIDRKIIREEFIKEYGRKPTREELKNLVKKKRKESQEYSSIPNVKLGGYVGDRYNEKRKTRFGIVQDQPKKTIPASDLAKKWSGWKSQTGLKPAVEVILMVNKPRSERTIVDNVLKHGVGAINVDETRIPFGTIDDVRVNKEYYHKAKSNIISKNNVIGDLQKLHDKKGRFPANLLVSNDVLDTGKITKSGDIKPHPQKNISLFITSPKITGSHKGDSGGFSRFFSLDSWWSGRVKKLPVDIQKTFPFLCVPKASKSEREKGLEKYPLQIKKYRRPNEPERSAHGYNWNEERPDGSKRKPIKTRNIHPTVKPLRLMSYLITLSCPPNGVVLDPFLGSGTTMLASLLMNKNCIGIEINHEYYELAKARCFKKTSLIPKEYSFEIFK